ncbi:MAG: pseudouridine synthase, partial [Polaribacter sp.]|nr:pseudouridine synthase [Polaribacter sp.]
VIAKTEFAMANLSKQFFDRTTERLYYAIVWGTIDEDEGTIEGNIGRSFKNRLQMDVFPEGDFGKPAITHYKVLERLTYVTLVQCKLETGRTHQIRAHFKNIGHTLFNDEPFFLEMNTVPGMTEESILPQQAAAAGISLKELFDNAIQMAL